MQKGIRGRSYFEGKSAVKKKKEIGWGEFVSMLEGTVLNAFFMGAI